ncbi:MAG: Gfo/Idh/MocA family oxidoreductase [Oscillospiraceae bacterium]|nr:Gfo/Idh/MocA family oxidoreductase [Oscillospiraceae bacterium]
MLKIGIIGLGGISVKHIREIQACDKAKISAVCDINPETLKKVGDQLGIPESNRFTNYKDLIACNDVEAVEICTPNYLHIPMAMDVVAAGKALEVEKPLSVDYAGVDELLRAIDDAGVVNMTCFSYRFMPAVRYAKHLIEEGKLGKIINVDVAYLKSSGFWAGRRLDWRFVNEYAGCGVIGDLGVHLIDMTRYLVGDFKSVYAATEIVVKQRQKLDSDEYAAVETEDLASFMAKLEGNVNANFLISRCAIGNNNTIKFEIYGTEGVLRFNLNNPNELTVCIGEVDRETDSLHTVKVPAKYNVGQEETFIRAALGEIPEDFPVVREGAACQKIVDALIESAKTDSVVKVM